MIDEKTVASIANLARLEFSEEETKTFTKQLGGILDYAETLQALNTDGIAATSHVADVATPMRDDEVKTSDAIETIFAKDAPDNEENFFRVPKVI